MKTKAIVWLLGAIVVGFILFRFLITPEKNPLPTATGTSIVDIPTSTPGITVEPSATAVVPSLTATPEVLPSLPPEPTVTATQLPIVLQGQLFFDVNLSGKQDEISLRYFRDLIFPPTPDPRQNADLMKSLREYKSAHPELMDGTMVTLMEPGLSDYKVCGYVNETQAGCGLTDDDGHFEITESTIRAGDVVGVRISDTSSNKTGTMAYQNTYVKSVTMPAYVMNGFRVPEQKLIQTDLMKLSNTHFVSASSEPLHIGLTQGYLPYAPVKGDLYVYSFFDHDDRTAYGLDWRGRNCLMPPAYNQPPNKILDGTDGVIFGGQKGDLAISMGFGEVTFKETEEKGKQVIVMIDNVPHSVVYSHLDTVLVTNLQEVFVGQIIGIIGRSGKDVGAPQVHIEIGNNTKLDPFGDPQNRYDPIWTRYFSPVEFQ